MDITKIKLTVDDINQLFHEVTENEPPEGLQPMKGFEVSSPNDEYIVTFYVNKQGEIELQVRPPRGSYGMLEQLSYSEVQDMVNVNT